MRQRVVIALAHLRRARADHRRRADHGARRLGAGPDHLADQAPRTRPWHRRHAGDPRHGRDRRDRRPGRGDVCRPHRRDRPGAGCRAEPAASLCQGPDGRDPDTGERRRAAGPDPRLHAAAVGDPARLRVQPALRARVRPLPDRAAGADPARHAGRRLPSLRRRRQRRPRHDVSPLRRRQGPAPRVRRLEALAQPGARGRPAANFSRRSTASPSTSGRARPSPWSANPVPASPRSPGWWSACCRRARARSSSTACR